ncbi:hypothetical protein JOB18_047142 [Solea senegalensis]|uniref:Uncharacterized protein n=1 Tax=Solea senegalensis TaxID=28829 RepID=A0AAV6SRA1_SOLSE|nr:hypothetical protein JOB18_047142 [Solea senegalensis]
MLVHFHGRGYLIVGSGFFVVCENAFERSGWLQSCTPRQGLKRSSWEHEKIGNGRKSAVDFHRLLSSWHSNKA